MARRYVLTLAGLGIALLVATPVPSCTTVCLLEKEKAIVAYNYDFDPPRRTGPGQQARHEEDQLAPDPEDGRASRDDLVVRRGELSIEA